MNKLAESITLIRLHYAADIIRVGSFLTSLPAALCLCGTLIGILKLHMGVVIVGSFYFAVFAGTSVFGFVLARKISAGIEWAILVGIGIAAVVAIPPAFLILKVLISLIQLTHDSNGMVTAPVYLFLLLLSFGFLALIGTLIRLLYLGRRDLRADRIQGFDVLPTAPVAPAQLEALPVDDVIPPSGGER